MRCVRQCMFSWGLVLLHWSAGLHGVIAVAFSIVSVSVCRFWNLGLSLSCPSRGFAEGWT